MAAWYTWQILQEYQIGFVIVPNLVWFYEVMIFKLQLVLFSFYFSKLYNSLLSCTPEV